MMDASQQYRAGSGIPADSGGDGGAGGQAGIGTLISGLIGDMQDLVRAEVQLAKTELTDDAKKMGAAVAMLAAAAFIGLVGLIFLMLFAMYLLADWLGELWLGALIVAAALFLVTAILASIGRSRLSAASLKPEQTIDTLKEDQQWAKQQINSVKR
jgi:uncharacterized membrane protein YqjE